MKLKVTLAKEWVDGERLGYTGPESDFIAGFEKARKMSLDALSIHFENYYKIVWKIINLGEEEV